MERAREAEFEREKEMIFETIGTKVADKWKNSLVPRVRKNITVN